MYALCSFLLVDAIFIYFRIASGMLKVNTAHPGIKLQYSSDEGKTWHPLKSRAKLAGIIYIITTSYDGSRQSRAVRVDIK